MKKINKFNEWLAVHATLVFGSMWTTYLFFCYGFLPLLFPDKMDKLLYWSNTVQLWSLPLLMVGQNVLGRASEKRAETDHEMIATEFSEIKEMMNLLKDEISLQKDETAELTQVVHDLAEIQHKLHIQEGEK